MRDKLVKLENVITRIEKLVSEAKQVGTLYHVCTLDAYLKYILPNDTLQSSGKYFNWLYNGGDYVSFTRDKYFVVGTKSVHKSKVLVQLVIDGNKLSEKYKVGPYNDFAFGPDGQPVDDNDLVKYREKEEVVKGPIKNLSKYIKEIRIDVVSMDSSTLAMLRKSKLTGDTYKYFNFTTGSQDSDFKEFLKDNGVKNGDSLESVIPIFAKYVNSSKHGELLFSNDLDDVKLAIKSKANLDAKYSYGYVLPYYCSDEDEAKIISVLLKAGANPNIVDEEGNPVIATAIDFDNVKAVRLLIKYGADVNIVLKNGLTPLMFAVLNASSNMVKTLIEYGADVNYMYDGKTALSVAVKFDEIEAVKLLTEHGADINIELKDGLTPLNLAVSNSSYNIVKELIESGADVNYAPDGKTALSLATSRNIIKLLKSCGAVE